MNSYLIINQSLIKRQFNSKQNINSNYYKNQIVTAFYNEKDILYKTDLNFHVDVVSALKFSEDNKYLASGSMSGCVALWNIDEFLNLSTKPSILKNIHESLVCNLSFNKDSTKILTSTSDKKLYIHDLVTSENTQTITLESKIDDLSCSPVNSNILSFGCENGSLYLYDTRKPSYELIENLFSHESFHSLQYHPLNEKILLLTSGEGRGFFSYDLRNLQPSNFYYFLLSNNSGAFCARYNKTGDQIFAIRQNYCSVLFNTNNSFPIFEFDEYGFFNSFGFKECCFAGPNDEYVVSGSDNFNLYVWEIPKTNHSTHFGHDTIKRVNKAKYILKGHRSTIANVCYNYQRSIIASSAIEPTIKFWSPFSFDKKLEVEKNNHSNNEDHDRILNLNYKSTNSFNSDSSFIFDNSFERSNLMSAIDDILKFRFYHVDSLDEYKFEFPHKLYNLSTSNPFIQFQEDINIYFIKSLVLNLINGNLFETKLFEVMEDLNVKSNEKSNIKITMKLMSFLFEGKKFFSLWNLITYSVSYLIKQMVAIKNAIEDINKLYQNDVCINLDDKKDDLLKVLLVINLMNCYLLITCLKNKTHCIQVFQTMQSILSNLNDISFEFLYTPEVSKDIEKFFTRFEFSFEVDTNPQNINEKFFFGSNSLDLELKLSSSKLKKKFIEQFNKLKSLKKIEYKEPLNQLDFLAEIFCLLNSWLLKDDSKS